MTTLYTGIGLFLLLTLAVGLLRVARGPTDFDRMMAAQLLGTTAVAILLLLAEAKGVASLYYVALVFALLSAVAAIAFVRHSTDSEE